MKNEIYLALENGKVVCEGTYEECMEAVGCYDMDYGWYIPSWMDAGIIEK